jgi:hypothetical protein
MARQAVLIQDRANVAAEVHFVIRMTPERVRGAKETQKEKPEHPDAGRF